MSTRSSLTRYNNNNNRDKETRTKPYKPWEYDVIVKLVIIGDSGVGKSSLLTRYTDDEFINDSPSTVGVDFRIKNIELNDSIVKLQMWDTAGQERFRTITSSYYRGANAIALMYDVTNEDSFRHVQEWLSEVDSYADPAAPRILIANKTDLVEKRLISEDQGRDLSAELGVPYFETSAKASGGVEDVFQYMAKEVMTSQSLQTKPHKNTIVIEERSPSVFDRMRTWCSIL